MRAQVIIKAIRERTGGVYAAADIHAILVAWQSTIADLVMTEDTVPIMELCTLHIKRNQLRMRLVDGERVPYRYTAVVCRVRPGLRHRIRFGGDTPDIKQPQVPYQRSSNAS